MVKQNSIIFVSLPGEPLEKLKDVVENGANINCRYSTDTPLILAVNYAYTGHKLNGLFSWHEKRII